LKRLGTALHLVQNKLIVRGEPAKGRSIKLPRNNSVVVNQKHVRIGRILDIFGPVSRPYFVVRPYRGADVAVHLGKKLYFEER
jgi:RNA-binding protein